MNVGIIGAGNIAGTIGDLWARAGHAILYGARDPEKSRGLLAGGGTVGTLAEAATFGEVVFCSFPFGAWPDVSRVLAPVTAGKLVMDSANPYPERDGAFARNALDAGLGSGVPVARLLPGAKLVRAFNSVYFKALQSEAHRSGEKVGIPLAGDDPQALAVAADLVRDAGFAPVIVGALGRARDFDQGTAVYNTGMSGAALAHALGVDSSSTLTDSNA